jgi:hypothetical protein
MRDAELLARVSSAAFAPQPLSVEQMSSGQVNGDPAPTEPLDRLAVEGLGGPPFTQ